MSDKIKQAWGAGSRDGKEARLRSKMPTYKWLEKAAQKRIPNFAFDFVHSGTGTDWGVDHNRQSFDAIKMVPRFGVVEKVSTEVTLFGKTYNSPIGISPVGMDALVWPGSSLCLARAARDENIPYITGTLANSTVEEVAEICGANTWLQLYGLPRNDHQVTFDLIARAKAVGVSAIVATLDAPVRAKRPRDMRNRLTVPFRPSFRTVYEIATSPHWALAVLRNGMPTFGNMRKYIKGTPNMDRVAGFVQKEIKGTFTWEEIRRMRDAFDGALIVKGVLHPDDAEVAIGAGVDGILVSNHGGRQSDAAPSAIDVLPAICDRVSGRASVMLDSGVQSGLDATRALALGADAVFCGRAFLYGLAAIGDDGGSYVSRLIKEELEVAMAQSGSWNLAKLRQATLKHPNAFEFEKS